MHNYKELQSLFETNLEKEIAATNSRQPKYLYEPVAYTLQTGGKRIRPVLLLMAYELYDSKFEKAMPAAFAIEMFHNFTLLHDDIMDDANLRRNNPTVHVKYSNNTAILSGDAMSILSYEYLNSTESKNYREIFDIFTKTALKICEGQQFDMDFENQKEVTVDEYLKMIGMKTAVLIAASLKIGALTANASRQEADLLYDFGYNLGMAFQLRDDYLDSFGNTSSFGKKIGGDIIANKKTYLMLKALELANNNLKEQLNSFMENPPANRDEKITKVLSIYEQLDVARLTSDKMEEYYQKALLCWENLNVLNNQKQELLLIANKMMNRTN
ncbi:MAG: polyprenyl synthetase family protein [Prolixibacteraceae bacterium]|jgi:geranylgeranyl diphosphate synthase type II|nr:polyprenyl synthetase family protein [Prolixibacteraceae bacterium]